MAVTIPKYSCLQMSPSQIQLKLPWHCTLASRRPALATQWVWPYFEVTTVEHEWIVKRTGKRRIVDRDICCAYVDEKTGTKCDWKTTEYDNLAASGKGYSPLGHNIKAAFHRRSGSRF
ncbi:hypothetical protein V8E54_013956 [Elaphomyces granulatus]